MTLPVEACVLLGAPMAALAVGFLIVHRRAPRWTHWPVLLSCACVTWASASLAARVLGGASWDETLYRWAAVGNFAVEFGVRVDGLGAAVLAMVCLVGTLIHVYAVGYMREDPGFSRFFLFFHLFLLSMIGLILSNNYLQLYVFWEGVGLASYLLIGFWCEREAARAAALKAFLVNRVGDACFLLAVFLLLTAGGTVRFTELFGRLAALDDRLLTLAALGLFAASTAKSAQFPLYVWLPDAMEGPTPTSALMHAATMVAAGVFLMARSWPLLERCPSVPPLIAAVGAATALGAAVLASAKRDLKRILAYSTISHLGLMMTAVGLGQVFAAVYHLVVHGFFKALLFLCAGNVLHTIGKSSATVDEVGGLGRSMPWTAAAFGVGALTAGGFFPTAGFFSKDAILEAAFESGPVWMRAALCLVSFASSFYIFRMFWLTFSGDRPRQSAGIGARHAREAGAWMLLPALALCAGAALGPAGGLLRRLVTAAPLWNGEPFHAPHVAFGTAWLGTALALGGLALSAVWCLALPGWDWDWREAAPRLAAWLDGDFGWQAVVLRGVALPAAAFARLTAWNFDIAFWDRLVESAADSLVGLAEGASGLARGLANEHIWWMAAGAAALLLGVVLQ